MRFVFAAGLPEAPVARDEGHLRGENVLQLTEIWIDPEL